MKKSTYNLLRILLFVLFVSLFLTLFFSMGIFFLTFEIYIFLAFLFLSSKVFMWGYAELNPLKTEEFNQPYSVILCAKNEDYKILLNCVNRIIKQKGIKEILIGDDGSRIPIKSILPEYMLNQIKIIRSEGIGKKNMQVELMKIAKYDIGIQIDSDVWLRDEETILNLISIFNDKNVGLVNGVIVLKSNGSILENVQEYQYACANEIGRRGMGRFGVNPCATGELLAFRLDVFKKFINEYRNKEHICEKMNFGEDRLMTNIFLREGYKSSSMDNAIAYTFPKKNFKDWIKQQTRWKRSGIRESIRCAKEVKNPYLKVWSILNFILPLVFYLISLCIFIDIILLRNWFGLLLFLSAVTLITVISDLPLLIRKPKLISHIIPFIVYNLLFIIPLWFVSLFTQTTTKWGTR